MSRGSVIFKISKGIIDDPRNELYKYFIKAVNSLLPKIVVMENVRGMLKVADQVVEDYNRISVERDGFTFSYDVAYQLLNSADSQSLKVVNDWSTLPFAMILLKNMMSLLKQSFNRLNYLIKAGKRFLLRDATWGNQTVKLPA